MRLSITPSTLSSFANLFVSCTILDRQIPTILSYVDGEEYTGNQAKAMLIRNPTNTVVSFKDFLGQEYVFPL